MRETGRILRIENDRAFVEMDFKGGCKSCAAAGGCTAKGPGKRELNLPLNDASIRPGDWVEIETRPRSLLTAAFLVFILPLLLAIGAYFIAQARGVQGDNTTGVFFAAFIAAEGVVYLIDKWIGRNRFFEPEIVKPLGRLPEE